MSEPELTSDSPVDVFVYHVLRGQPKALNDGREWNSFRLFGWTSGYERVCVLIRDTPTVAYLELRPRNDVVWTKPRGWIEWLPIMRHELALLKDIFLTDSFQNVNMGRYSKFGFKWRGIELVEKVLSSPGRYDFSVQRTATGPYPPVATPLLRLGFESSFAMRDFEAHVRLDTSMRYGNDFDVYLHETDSFLDVPTRCFAQHDLPQSGWMRINEYQRYLPEHRTEEKTQSKPSKSSKFSKPTAKPHQWCRPDAIEWDLVSSWDALQPLDTDVPPLLPRRLMVFDIETYSSRSVGKQAYPKHTLEEDCVFQVSIVIWSGERPQDPPDSYLLSLKEPDPIPDCTVVWCTDERDLLLKLIDKVDQCDVFTGWNILNYDWEYVYYRCVRNGLSETLLGVGCVEGLLGRWVEKVSDSKAHATQNYKYFEAEGKLHVDMLPLIKRDYKLRNYKLNTVLQRFKMPQMKDDLKADEMFKLYRLGTPATMATIARYCFIDSRVCLDLWLRLNIWIGLLEMSKLTGVSLVTICTKGTQIQMATRVVRVLWKEDRVLGQLKDFDPANPTGRKQVEEHSRRKEKKYTGATVFKAVPGLYRWVVVLDFASLYPSIMRGRNLDYATLVHDTQHSDGVDLSIPDDLCNVIEFSDHKNCPHDTNRKRLKNGEFSKAKVQIVCADNRFRWLKEEVVGEGLLPRILSDYLNARKATRKAMAVLREAQLVPLIASVLVDSLGERKEDPSTDELTRVQGLPIFDEIMNTGEKEVTLQVVNMPWQQIVQTGIKHANTALDALVESIRATLVQLVVLDKRQLAFKVCANRSVRVDFGAIVWMYGRAHDFSPSLSLCLGVSVQCVWRHGCGGRHLPSPTKSPLAPPRKAGSGSRWWPSGPPSTTAPRRSTATAARATLRCGYGTRTASKCSWSR